MAVQTTAFQEEDGEEMKERKLAMKNGDLNGKKEEEKRKRLPVVVARLQPDCCSWNFYP